MNDSQRNLKEMWFQCFDNVTRLDQRNKTQEPKHSQKSFFQGSPRSTCTWRQRACHECTTAMLSKSTEMTLGRCGPTYGLELIARTKTSTEVNFFVEAQGARVRGERACHEGIHSSAVEVGIWHGLGQIWT